MRRLSERDVILRSISEIDFQNVILESAEALGWWSYHPHDSRHSTAGWPDLVLIRPPRALFLELKKEVGKVSPEQCHVLEMLEDCGFICGVFRPSQQDELLAILRARP